LQVLEEDGMVKISKDGEGARAQTTIRVTASGRSRYLEYLRVLEQVVRDATAAQPQEEESRLLRKLTPLSS
jgi:DNA-binding MarR family transcriptional regulator